VRKKPRLRRRKSALWARIALAGGIALVVVSGGTFTAIGLAAQRVDAAIPDEDLLGSVKGSDQKSQAEVDGAKNILLVSLDTRPSWSKSHEPSRSDSIIIMHVPADHSTAYMLSIPRDTLINIPAYDNGAQKYGGGANKINSAFAFGSRGLDGDKAIQDGTKLLALTIQQKFGIVPDAAAIIDYSGFKQIVQVLGKVCMYVDENVTSIHVGKKVSDGSFAVPYKTDSAGANPRKVPGTVANKYTVGNHCFTPVEALDYARQRDLLSKGDGDYGRQRHQQQLLKAIMKTAVSKGLDSPTKLPSLLDAVGKAMVVDTGGISLENWALGMKSINPDNLVTLKTNTDVGGFLTVPQSQTPPGVGQAQGLDAESLQMFQAAKDDAMSQFVLSHPTWVAAN
jgi:anionic cell wall polymer biosynthesis LytR-Cps2A-Psr (LCP) family protein